MLCPCSSQEAVKELEQPSTGQDSSNTRCACFLVDLYPREFFNISRSDALLLLLSNSFCFLDLVTLLVTLMIFFVCQAEVLEGLPELVSISQINEQEYAIAEITVSMCQRDLQRQCSWFLISPRRTPLYSSFCQGATGLFCASFFANLLKFVDIFFPLT